MAYSDTVKAFKDALNGYSEEENKLSELYKSALQRNEAAKNANLSQLDSDYKKDRNDAFADNARAEQSTARVLASRGLGFSGEMAQAKLNSDLSLSNRLGELSGKNAKSRQELIDQHERYAHDLSVEEAEKRTSLNEGKSKLLADIAKAELENEQKEKELELKYAQLEAEKELFNPSDSSTEQNTASNNGTGDTADHGNTAPGTTEENKISFSPEIKPKDLAKLMVQNATGNDYIKSDKDAYLVNKYLLDMIDNYELTDEYKKELVFMLKAYGHKELTYEQLRKTVITQDAKALYESAYSKRYKEYMDRGMSPSMSRTYAIRQSLTDAFDLLYSRTKNSKEFLEYCKAIKLSEEDAKTYASDKVWYKKQADTTPPTTERKPDGKPKNTVSLLR